MTKISKQYQWLAGGWVKPWRAYATATCHGIESSEFFIFFLAEASRSEKK
jgi:hypothetical protein